MNSRKRPAVSHAVQPIAVQSLSASFDHSTGVALKRCFQFLAGLFVFGCGIATVEASTRWETLEAIHAVENPHNRRSPGAYGELGAYQFRPDTWKMHSSRPFREALERSRSDEVAVKHYEWIKESLVRNGIEPSTYNIALAWNAGISSTVNGRAPLTSHDYASRVANIAQTIGVTVASVP